MPCHLGVFLCNMLMEILMMYEALMMMFQGEQEPVRGRSRSRQKPPVRPLLTITAHHSISLPIIVYNCLSLPAITSRHCALLPIIADNHILLPSVACHYLFLPLIVCHCP